MMKGIKISRRTENIYGYVLLMVVVSYVLLRAYYLAPLLDELATFHFYIRSGHYYNHIEVLDANNHLLISFLSHQLYSLFGDSFFLFRIPSVLSVIIYFLSIQCILRELVKNTSLRLLLLTSLVCIPWIFEYFSYVRGYALALSFFFAAIALLMEWKKNGKRIFYIAALLCLWLSITANLSYLLPVALVVLYFELLFIAENQLSQRERFIHFLTLFLFLLICWPILDYGFKLKVSGGLWWGNQAGLWQTTGRSLSQLIFFTEQRWVLYLLLISIGFSLFHFIRNGLKNGLLSYWKEADAFFIYLFLACLVAYALMRHLFDINYPMDRVGMYLVPLFLFMLIGILSTQGYLKYLLILFLFFPISFFSQLNLSTSIFSPEDRMPLSFSEKIKSELTQNASISADYVAHMSYAYACRNDSLVHMAYTLNEESKNYGSLHLFWKGCRELENYEMISVDTSSRNCFSKRKKSPDRALLIDTLFKDQLLNEEFLTLLEMEVDSSLKGKFLEVEMKGQLLFDRPTAAFKIVRKSMDKDGQTLSIREPQFSWYFSDRKDVNFVFTDGSFQIDEQDQFFQFYVHNKDYNQIKVESLHLKIYQLNEEQ